MALIECPECGKQVSDKAPACPNCGVPMAITPTPVVQQVQVVRVAKAPKSRVLTAVLALFLGGLGAHKFYLEEYAWGVIYLALCWTFIPAIVSVFETIYFLILSDDSFDKKFNQPQEA